MRESWYFSWRYVPRSCEYWGYRTLRVAGSVTFGLFGAENSVLEVVGPNVEVGQIVLGVSCLFGLLVWESPC